MKQLTDEQIIAAFNKVESETPGWRQQSLHAYKILIAEFCRINGITGEAQPAEQANGQEAVAKFASSQESLPPDMQSVLSSTPYESTPPAQPAREWVEVVRSVLEECDVPKAYQHAIIDKLREKNAGQPAAMKPWQIMPTVKDRATNRELPVTGVYEDVVFVDVPAADDKAGGDPVDMGDALRAAAKACPELILYNGGTQEPYIDINGGDLWCDASGLRKEEWPHIRFMVEAANYVRKLANTHPQPQAEVRVPDGFPLIKLGFGKVEVASGNHEGVPALIFGKNGTGVIGEATQPDRAHAEGETLACVTFANAESLEVVQHHINEARAMLAAAPKS